MGYTTEFYGAFKLNRPLADAYRLYLTQFSETRRMKRNSVLTVQRPDPVRFAVGLPVGNEGEFFVGCTEDFGQEHGAKDIVNYNGAPSTQPGLWCKWVPNEDGTAIEWNGAEKFYDYTEWLKYLIANFLEPWGYNLNGEVAYEGEDHEDFGKIVVVNNEVHVLLGKKTYE